MVRRGHHVCDVIRRRDYGEANRFRFIRQFLKFDTQFTTSRKKISFRIAQFDVIDMCCTCHVSPFPDSKLNIPEIGPRARSTFSKSRGALTPHSQFYDDGRIPFKCEIWSDQFLLAHPKSSIGRKKKASHYCVAFSRPTPMGTVSVRSRARPSRQCRRYRTASRMR